jgi:hypothetical protein
MQDLIMQGASPTGARIPAPIASERLWSLDVNDDLWMEITWDTQFQDGDAPKWLYNQPTRQGIHAMLELQQCEEALE